MLSLDDLLLIGVVACVAVGAALMLYGLRSLDKPPVEDEAEQLSSRALPPTYPSHPTDKEPRA